MHVRIVSVDSFVVILDKIQPGDTGAAVSIRQNAFSFFCSYNRGMISVDILLPDNRPSVLAAVMFDNYDEFFLVVHFLHSIGFVASGASSPSGSGSLIHRAGFAGLVSFPGA
jgi:hypothetical protein